MSPRHGRHPYLLYSGFAVALGWSGELLAKLRAGVEAKKEEGKGKGKERMREESWSEDEEWIEREGVNGEAVREGIERWRARQGWKAAVWGVGWGLAVLGIWGDGV